MFQSAIISFISLFFTFINEEKEDAMTTFIELLQKRQAIRDFEDKEVPLKLVEEILQESTLAPSASNNSHAGLSWCNAARPSQTCQREQGQSSS